MLCRANLDLAEIAEVLGEDSGVPRTWHERTAAAINTKLWHEDDGAYYSYDRVAGKLLLDETIATFHPLYGRVPTAERAQRLIDGHLLDTKKFWPEHGTPIPTTSMDSPWYNPENYWLGPVWVNTNWMVLHGLRDYGHADRANSIAEGTLGLIAKSGFREYFQPETGEGFGTNTFSWSAALSIDLLAEA